MDEQVNTSPEMEVIPTPEPSPEPEAEPASQSKVTYKGNTYDLTALIGVIIGGTFMFTCFTCNIGWYCLPVIAMVLGAIGLYQAKASVDPERTRLLSWIGLGTGGAMLILIILFVVVYIGLLFFVFMNGAATGYGGY